MKTYLRPVIPITLALLAACSGNNIDVGWAGKDGPPDGPVLPLSCEYQGKLYTEGQAQADHCNCFCDGKTGQFQCALLLCKNDAGTETSSEADAPVLCEYQGRMVGVDEVFPAKDGCNTCSCNPALREVLCTQKGCYMDGGASVTSDASNATACPFIAAPKPITLGTILGAGKSPSTGIIYLVDRVDSLERVFVSGSDGGTPDSHQVLNRQRVSGSGAGQDFLVFTTNGPDDVLTVQIDTPAGGTKRMGVVAGTLKDGKTITIGRDGEELTLLADSAVASIPLNNLPGTVTIEYVASTADGNFILVTRPLDDWTYADFRLFYGPVLNMDEKKVDSVTRARDGGSTRIVFKPESKATATATANFPVVSVDAGFAPGPATLTMGGQDVALTRLGAPPAEAKYTCFIP